MYLFPSKVSQLCRSQTCALRLKANFRVLHQILPWLAEVSSAVWIGHDTRPSCKELVAAAWQGIEAAGGRVENKGLLTTPQLHWMIRQRNKSLPCTEADYFSTLAEAYHRLTHDRASGEVRDMPSSPPPPFPSPARAHLFPACKILSQQEVIQ